MSSLDLEGYKRRRLELNNPPPTTTPSSSTSATVTTTIQSTTATRITKKHDLYSLIEDCFPNKCYVETPFQHPNPIASPRLGFNYWTEQRHITHADLHQLITSILCNKLESEYPAFISPTTNQSINHVVIVTVHNMCPVLLSHTIAQGHTPFLSSCSSVPIRHAFNVIKAPQNPNGSSPDNWWRFELNFFYCLFDVSLMD